MRTVYYLIAALIACVINSNQSLGQDKKSIFHSRSTLASRMELTSVTNLIGHKYRMSIKMVQVDLSAAKQAGLDLVDPPQSHSSVMEVHSTLSMYELLEGLEKSDVVRSRQLPDVVSKSGENIKQQFEVDGIKGGVSTICKVKDGDLSHTTVQLYLVGPDGIPFRETYKAKLSLGQTYLMKSLERPILGKTHWIFVNIDDLNAE